MRKYSTLLFDLDDTLLDYSSDEKKAILTVFKNNNINYGEDVLTVYSNFDMWHTFKLGDIITAKTVVTYNFLQLIKYLQINADRNKLIDEFYKIMEKSHSVKTGAIKTLTALKQKGYRIYLTSNGFPEFQYKRIKSARLSKFFSGIFISEEIGRQKPSRAFFDFVINRIPESDRSKILVIGDAPTADIFGGINSKLDTCWLDDKNKFCKYKPTLIIKKINDLIDIL